MSIGEALTLLDEPTLDAVVLDGLLGKELAWVIADILAQRQVPFLLMTGVDTLIPPAHGHAPTLAKPVAGWMQRRPLNTGAEGPSEPPLRAVHGEDRQRI